MIIFAFCLVAKVYSYNRNIAKFSERMRERVVYILEDLECVFKDYDLNKAEEKWFDPPYTVPVSEQL